MCNSNVTRNDVYETLCPQRMLLQMVAKLVCVWGGGGGVGVEGALDLNEPTTLSGYEKKKTTRKCVYETLCPQLYACMLTEHISNKGKT